MDLDLSVLAIEPGTQQRKQFVGIDGFGDIVGGAGDEAFVAITLHGFGGQR